MLPTDSELKAKVPPNGLRGPTWLTTPPLALHPHPLRRGLLPHTRPSPATPASRRPPDTCRFPRPGPQLQPGWPHWDSCRMLLRFLLLPQACTLLSPPGALSADLEACPAHSKPSVNICWMSKWTDVPQPELLASPVLPTPSPSPRDHHLSPQRPTRRSTHRSLPGYFASTH